MITLYVKTGCPFAAKAIKCLEEHGIEYKEKNIADPSVVEELKEIGGKKQVPYITDDNLTPCLVDDDIAMYEANAIVDYLRKKYGKEVKSSVDSNVRLHVDDDSETCDGCQ